MNEIASQVGTMRFVGVGQFRHLLAYLMIQQCVLKTNIKRLWSASMCMFSDGQFVVI